MRVFLNNFFITLSHIHIGVQWKAVKMEKAAEGLISYLPSPNWAMPHGSEEKKSPLPLIAFSF